ncbi:MAG: SpoIID/LytB domain-containing protein [Candidatus Krumholzibacteriia bacterium]|nr:SpoIID/LytB domain-containing protein [bacterium]MCB9512745.1 SpoIID/LytB domain-containing protein [Candidatus Latescibacterota bacterium]MCB9516832.1 SpoIID/LytB domain-containing protein [Candidatus Latescibacterota bacterium]
MTTTLRTLRNLALVSLGIALLAGCSAKSPVPVVEQRTVVEAKPERLPALQLGREPDIRILLTRNVSAVEVRCSRGFVALDARGRVMGRYGTGQRYHFFQSRRSPDRLEVYSESLRGGARTRAALGRLPFHDAVYLQPESGGVLSVNGQSYRGRFKLWREGDHFSCLNLLPLELYLRGVVPHEIGHLKASGFEAMKAQAVASRNYALQRLADSRDRPWDMVDTVFDQVYRGVHEESRWANRAIEATRGQVLYDGARPAEVYYSSTCGGYTTDIDQVWKHAPAAHLVAVRDADAAGRSWCHSSKYFRWRHSWSARELGQILRAYLPAAAELPSGTKIGYIRDVRITQTTPEGRAKRLEVETDRGTFVVKGDRIRSALKRDLDGNALRSILFQLQAERDAQGRLVRLTAVGAGWGHGIGMCQVGAIARSAAGESYDQILAAYYPGTRLRRVWH